MELKEVLEYFEMNKLQSPMTPELMEEIPKEVWDDLIYTVQQIKFIKNLIAPESIRGFARDKERKIGRAHV